jgi:hypothetical protein
MEKSFETEKLLFHLNDTYIFYVYRYRFGYTMAHSTLIKVPYKPLNELKEEISKDYVA